MIEGNGAIIKDALIMLHPERWKLICALKELGKPLFIGQLADKIGTDRRLISYHLSTLEEHGFVKSEFKVIEPPSSKGKAGRFYELTSKVDEIKPKLAKIIQS